MTDRIALSDLTSEQLDALQDEISYLQQLSAEQGQALTRACSAREEQRARAEQAEADRDRVQQVACRTAENLRPAVARAERAEAAVERVRELHQRWDADPGSCAHCVDGYGTPLRYPCPTARALDQAQQPAGE